MSKLSKFYSVGIDMYKGAADAASDEMRVYLSADAMDEAVSKAEAFLKAKGISFEEAPSKEKGTAQISVTCKGEPILCEVRFYPILEGDTFRTDYEPSGRIDFTRVVTGLDGKVSASLDEGKYLVKVSKGSEYEITYSETEIFKDKTSALSLELTRFINLTKDGIYAGDIHHHSIYSSPVWGGTDDVIESCEEVSFSMQAKGLTYGALSDHHNVLNHKEWKATESKDFLPIPSKEISTSNGHVLALGVDEYDVIYRIPEAKDRTEKYLRDEFVRITDEIKAHDGLPQLNHPRDLSISISWNRDFYDMTGIFETIEIWNGSNPMYYGTTDAMAALFWRDLLEKGEYIPATTGSDTHNTRANDYHGIYAHIKWLSENIARLLETSDADEFKEERYTLESFVRLTDKFLPMLEVWAKTSLTSGCVRTYVDLGDKEKSRRNILDALRHGNSFLTNGPVLLVNVNGAKPGENVNVENGKADIDIKLTSNRPIAKLEAFLSNKKSVLIPITERKTEGHYDYSLTLKDFDIADSKYIFFVASKDCTNIAITNPVLIG